MKSSKLAIRMHTPLNVLVILTVALTLSACGGGRSSSPATTTSAETNPLIPQRTGLFSRGVPEVIPYEGVPLDQVTELVVERVPGGVIVRATGLAARPGVYLAQLTPATEGDVPVDGVLTYRIEAIQGPPTGIAYPAPQEVTVARSITRQQLRGVNSIRVEAATNALVSSR